MHDLDKRLRALADCAVIPMVLTKEEIKKNKGLVGGITFGPYPTIVASNDVVLSHEICHRLAGKRDYDIFNTAVWAKDCPVFKFVLNILYDWYHEWKYEAYSPFLKFKIEELHEIAATIEISKGMREVKELMYLFDLYDNRTETPDEVGIKDCHTLVYLAEKIATDIRKKLPPKKYKALIAGLTGYQQKLGGKGITGAGGHSYSLPLWSNYYSKAVSKYSNTINILKDMWTRNKYAWQNKHYGEIDWKNLVKVYAGEKIKLPVFLVLAKILLLKNIHLVVDRSGSTQKIKGDLMDTAIIIAESLRQCGTPISIIDVGVENKIVNGINSPIKPTWFTPMAKGGTPTGEVCMNIKENNFDSLLIMITDGWPDSFPALKTAIHKFPGTHLTFIIGQQYYQSYATEIGNSLCVEPHTIIKELMYYIEKGGQV
jgi:hypothetical protein